MRKFAKLLSFGAIALVALVVAGIAILGSVDVNKYKPIIVDAAKSMTGRDLHISGDLELELSLSPKIAVNDVRFGNAAWGSRPAMVAVRRLAAEVSLIPLFRGGIEVNELVLEGVDILLETDATGRVNWALTDQPEVEPKGPDTRTLPAVQDVVLKDVQLKYRNGKTGVTRELSIDSFSANAEAATSPIAFDMQGRVNGEEVRLRGMVGTAQQVMAVETEFPAEIFVDAVDSSASFDGRIGRSTAVPISVDGRVTLSASSPRETASRVERLLGLSPGGLKVPDLEAVKVGGDLVIDGQTITVNGLSIVAGQTDLAGNVAVSLDSRPRIDAALVSNFIDVGSFMLVKADAADKSDVSRNRVFPDDALPVEALRAVDLDFKLDAKKIGVNAYEVSDLTTRLTLYSGNLNVSTVRFQIADGEVSGTISADSTGEAISVAADLRLEGIDYGVLLAQSGQASLIAGRADGNLLASGRGTSVRSIMASLNGNVRVSTENAEIESGALGFLSSDVLSVLPGLSANNVTTLRCGVIDAEIVDGIAKGRAIVFETDALAAIGVGGVDLGNEAINLVIDPRVKNTSLASAAVVPVTIGGTFLDPTWSLDAAALATGAAGTVAKGAAAFATMGLSLLAESIAKRAVGGVDTFDYCTPALAGQTVVPKSTGNPQNSSAGDNEAPSNQSGASGVVDGVSKGIRSLFGN